MQKFNPSKGYWRITPQNRFHIAKDADEKNIDIFKKLRSENSGLNKIKFVFAKICQNIFFTFHNNKVRFCSVFEKKFFYLLRFFLLIDIVVKYSIPIRFLIPISCFGIF